MKISTSEAVKRFFQNPTLEMVYAEAFANAIDAGATDISISINLKRFTDPSSLHIVIHDNGCGFDAINYGKFSELMKKSDRRHKGLGRLVYLEYFKQVKIESVFEENKLRKFVFNEDFKGDEESSTVTKLDTPQSNYSKLEFCGFVKDKIHEYEDVSLSGVKKGILERFLPQLLALKE